MASSKNKSVVFALISVAIWSTLSTVAKLVLGALPNLETLGVSSLFAFLFMAAALLVSGKYRLLKTYAPRQYFKMAALGFLGLFLYSALYYFGLGSLTAGDACILNYLWPVMLVLFSCVILKEKLTMKMAIALLCSFAGVVVLSFGGSNEGGGRWIGMAACVIAAACYGLYCVLNKKSGFDQTVMMTVVWLTVTVCCFAVGPFIEEWAMPAGMQWVGLVWLGVFVNAAAYLTWGLALQKAEGTALVANLAYIVPFLSVIISTAVLKEELKLTAVAALVLIVGGILLQSVKHE